MPGIAKLVPGQRVLLETDRYDLDLDRRSGTLRLVHRPKLRRAREQVIPLENLDGLRVRWSERTVVTWSRLRKVREITASSPKRLAPHEIDALLPPGRNLRLWLDETDTDGKSVTTPVPIPLEEIDTVEQLIELAMNLAAAAGLPYIGVFEIPGFDAEVHAMREPGRGLVELPSAAVERGGETLSQAAADLLAGKILPPFEPDALGGDLDLVDWRPGDRVVFRRGLRLSTVLAAPLSLLMLGGPVLGVLMASLGRPMDAVTLVIVSMMGCAFGGAFLYFFFQRLPRRVVFDWREKTLAVEAPVGGWTLRFSDIDRLDLRLGSESTSSEGGGTTSWFCELKVVPRGQKPRLLLTTDQADNRETPLRRALPLVTDLAAALGVRKRVDDHWARRR
jgi:hypothetical protein